MTTVINTPGNSDDSGSNLIAVLILIVVIVGAGALFFMYGLPMIQNSQKPSTTNINVTTPTIPATTPAP